MVLKKLIQSVAISRLIIYFVIIGFLPTVYVGYNFLKKRKEWEQVAYKLRATRHLSQVNASKQSLNQLVRERYVDVDPFYLDNQLESIVFLKKERESLEKILKSPTYTGNEGIEKRYAYLISAENRLQFTEVELPRGEGFQENIASLSHSIEVDEEDLQELLAHIETYHQHQPQLIITDFKLKRKTNLDGIEVFELTTKLLKREFLK